ncbi:MAG TPA: pitrilysin family protein [Casimicrobiaceae bacterium]
MKRPLVPLQLLFALLLLPLAALAALPAGVTPGPVVEGVSEYRLANGLRVILYPDPTKPTTTVDVTYLVGSRMEDYGETGMAHLLEHMLFKGTPSIKSVFAELSRRGAEFNGNTSYDRTTYFETFTASEANLGWVLRMESERMTHATFTKAELDSEMTVVRNEFESGENQPQPVLWKRMAAAAFDWHNYGKPTIGARSDIENVPFERLRAFYTRYYQPDNAVLTIAGRFDADRTLALIAKYFGPLPKPTRVLPKLYTVEPAQDGIREVVVRRVASTQYVAALFHMPPGAHPDDTAGVALAEIMTVQPAGRLYKALVDTGKASAVSNYYFEQHDPGFVIFFAHLQPGKSIEDAKAAMLDTLLDVGKNPITEAELARVRTKALKDFDDTVNDPQRFAVAIAEAVAIGDWRLFFIQRDRWRALQPQDVTRVAEQYLKRSNLTVGEFLPEGKVDRAPVIASVDVASMVRGYKGDPAVQPGEAFDPTPANLAARTQRFDLPNGMKVALLPKKTRGATVNFELRMDYGDVDSLRNMNPLPSLTAAMLRRGTERLDRQAFEDALDQRKASLDFGGSAGTLVASGHTVAANLGEVLRLMKEAVATPAMKPEEFDQVKRERHTRLEQGRTDPTAIARRAIARQGNPYPPGDIRYVPTIEEDIAMLDKATIDAVKSFHDRFYGASHAEIAIVGDFDVQAIKPLVTELFGNYSTATAYTRVPDPYVRTEASSESFETPDKPNATMISKLAVPLNDLAPDFASVVVANRILGGDVDSRLFERIRVKEGLSYGVGTQLTPARIDPNSQLLFYAIFAPQNLDKVKAAFSDVVTRARNEGYTAQEVDTAKKALLEERRIARAQDADLAGVLVTQAFLGRDWNETARQDKAIEAVTLPQANAALRKYITPDSMATVYAGDFVAENKNLRR